MPTLTEFRTSLSADAPDASFAAPLQALWWDAKGEWDRAHRLVDELDSKEAMAVHAFLHRKEGDIGNAAYWYRRAGSPVHCETLEEEWSALVRALLSRAGASDSA